jgi:hypothetical protein
MMTEISKTATEHKTVQVAVNNRGCGAHTKRQNDI